MKRKTNKTAEISDTIATPEMTYDVTQVNRDAMTAVLIVSLMINLFVLTGWVALQVTTAFDPQVAAFLFTR